MKLRPLMPVVAVLTGLFVLSACGGAGDAKNASAQAPAAVAPTAAATTEAAPSTTDPVDKLLSADSKKLGAIVTDQNGFTLYRFGKDTIAPPTSNCSNQCSVTWPPAIVTTTDITLSGVNNSAVGTITRADGSKQLTVGGWPVYRYNQDEVAGDINGQGVGQTWFAVTPTGAKASSVSTGATLSTAESAKLGTIVTDADGFTLYRFDKDTADPSKSTCNGTCAKTWPPAVIPNTGKLTLNGVDKAKVGTVTRADGSKQLTIGGWPVYEFNKDTKQGDIKGQGVKGTWFAVTPTGAKNTGQEAASDSAAAAPAKAAVTAGTNSGSGY